MEISTFMVDKIANQIYNGKEIISGFGQDKDAIYGGTKPGVQRVR